MLYNTGDKKLMNHGPMHDIIYNNCL